MSVVLVALLVLLTFVLVGMLLVVAMFAETRKQQRKTELPARDKSVSRPDTAA
jgi:hypothetical protein